MHDALESLGSAVVFPTMAEFRFWTRSHTKLFEDAAECMRTTAEQLLHVAVGLECECGLLDVGEGGADGQPDLVPSPAKKRKAVAVDEDGGGTASTGGMGSVVGSGVLHNALNMFEGVRCHFALNTHTFFTLPPDSLPIFMRRGRNTGRCTNEIATIVDNFLLPIAGPAPLLYLRDRFNVTWEGRLVEEGYTTVRSRHKKPLEIIVSDELGAVIHGWEQGDIRADPLLVDLHHADGAVVPVSLHGSGEVTATVTLAFPWGHPPVSALSQKSSIMLVIRVLGVQPRNTPKIKPHPRYYE